MMITVIDGMGGGLGVKIILDLKKRYDERIKILALGTNSTATAAMKKAGADLAATGENPVVVNCKKATLILGPIAIITPDGLMGEITPRMAEAITLSDAKKILLPSDRCNIDVVSTPRILNMTDLIKELVDRVGEELF
ncbi:MAG: Uncharacterized protein XD91_0934 [Clostridiales bacterium 38_11]|nr:MAG: Uncharacterized protein XD91_0934 [Clostridiales bacterium 38_11]HBH12335.1 hypothetical protein [Clostridiales bacterium]